MNLKFLKQQTSAEHDHVETSLRVMEDALTESGYVETLRRLYGFVRGWERWASQSPSIVLQRLLNERQRSELLLRDLRHFAAEPYESMYPGPNFSASSEAHVLGGLYVMEGSTLGGQLIARHVEARLLLSPGVGDAFFRGYGDATGSMWQEVKEALTAVPEDQSETVILAAKHLFADFASWNQPDAPCQGAELSHA